MLDIVSAYSRNMMWCHVYVYLFSDGSIFEVALLKGINQSKHRALVNSHGILEYWRQINEVTEHNEMSENMAMEICNRLEIES